MKFLWEGKEFELRGIEAKPYKIISSHGMTKILNKQQRGVIVQLCSLNLQTSKLAVSQDLQRSLTSIPRYLILQNVSHLLEIMIMVLT